MKRLVLVIGVVVVLVAIAGAIVFKVVQPGLPALLDSDCGDDVDGVIAFNQGGEYTDDIVVLDADGEPTRVTRDEASWDPSFSPDGSQIAFVRGQGSFSDSLGWLTKVIFVMDVDGSDQRQLTKTKGHDEAPVWSPDGKWIAFSRSNHGLMVAPAAGGDAELVYSSGVEFDAIDWSPDSRRIAFAGEPGMRHSIYVIDRDGSNLRTVAADLDHISELSWSPDGETIAFGDWNKIYTITFEESIPRLFARNAHTATFSPDGKHLAYFEQEESFSRHLVVAPLEGGEPRPIEIDQDIYSFENDLDWLDCP